MLICMSCYESYVKGSLASNRRGYVLHFCPKSSCRGPVVEIDELMCPTIIELNRKGYKTNFCCSSHWNEDPDFANAYISFNSKCNFDTLPSEFNYDKDDKSIIRKRFRDHSQTYLNLFQFSIYTANDLFLWARNLPDISKKDTESII